MPSKLWDEITYPFPNFKGSQYDIPIVETIDSLQWCISLAIHLRWKVVILHRLPVMIARIVSLLEQSSWYKIVCIRICQCGSYLKEGRMGIRVFAKKIAVTTIALFVLERDDTPIEIWGVLCQKQVSRAGTSNYIPQILWDVITCPCPWYLLPAQHSSYELRAKTLWRNKSHGDLSPFGSPAPIS